MTIEGETYVHKTYFCKDKYCPSREETSIGYFIVVENGIRKYICRRCITKKPSLIIWSNMILNKVRKTYFVEGKYLRRKYESNHFKLDKKNPLLDVLKLLRKKGYRVPLFGKNKRQIAVKTKQALNDKDIDLDFRMQLQLSYWRNEHNGKSGYNLICV